MFTRRRPPMRAAVVGGRAYIAGKHKARKSDQRAADEANQDERISARSPAGSSASIDVDGAAADVGHLIGPEERLRISMARQ